MTKTVLSCIPHGALNLVNIPHHCFQAARECPVSVRNNTPDQENVHCQCGASSAVHEQRRKGQSACSSSASARFTSAPTRQQPRLLVTASSAEIPRQANAAHCTNDSRLVPLQLGRLATAVAGCRQQAVTCAAHINAASAVVEAPSDTQTPQEVASVFQRLQNGSDIRGIAIAGLSKLVTDARPQQHF